MAPKNKRNNSWHFIVVIVCLNLFCITVPLSQIKPEIRTGRSGLGVQENRLRTSTNDQITQSLPSSGPGKSRQKTSHQKREDRLSLTVKRFKEAEEKQRNPNAEHGHE